MKRTIQTDNVRSHTLSDRQVQCFNTSIGMSDGYIAKTGDWITFEETAEEIGTSRESSRLRSGRMLGSVDADPCGETPKIRGYLSVLALSDNCCHAYIRWIKPEDVRGINKVPPAAFLAFVTGELPSAEMIHKLSAYGTLSQAYIDKVPHHIKAWESGVSPAAYDAGVRKE